MPIGLMSKNGEGATDNPAYKLPNLFDLRARVAIITGGAGLLGQRHCEALAEAGANIIVADIRADEAHNVAARIGHEYAVSAVGIGVDICDNGSVGEMTRQVDKKFGRIDILVNNAGMTVKGGTDKAEQYFQAFENYPEMLWQRALSVGLTGTFLCSQNVGRIMLRQGHGVIVNISSTYGLVGPDQRIYDDTVNPYDSESSINTPASYSVVKAGILGLTRYLATYWRGKEIRVNSLSPGGVYDGHDESFVRNYSARVVLGRMARKDEYKGALLFLASDASSYMTGSNLVVDGGWTAW